MSSITTSEINSSSSISKTAVTKVVLFFIWPALSLFWSLMTYRSKVSRLLVYGFCIFYGFTFVISNKEMDAERYMRYLEKLAMEKGLGLSLFEYLNQPNGTDITLTSVTYFVSRFTDNYSFLFSVFAIIFGFFYLRNVNSLFHELKKTRNINGIIFLIFFAFLVPIFDINAFRFWTATWVFFYGAYNYLVSEKKRWLIFSALACVVHFSFMMGNAVLWIYILFGNRILAYTIFFVLSFFFSNQIIIVTTSIADFLGGGFTRKAAAYTNPEYIKMMAKNFNSSDWFVLYVNPLVKYYLLGVMAFIHFKYKKIRRDTQMRNLFSFSILMVAFATFGHFVPGLDRFTKVSFLFLTAYIILFYSKTDEKGINIMTVIGLVPMLIWIAIRFRIGVETMNVYLFFPTIFGLVFPKVAISEFIY